MSEEISEKRKELIDKAYEKTKKAKEKRRILLINMDAASKKLLVAWDLVTRTYGEMEGDNMWDGVKWDSEEWCTLAGIPYMDMSQEYCDRLVNCGLIFPDGRVHFHIEKYLMDLANREPLMWKGKGGKK
jgi:hypothetical protein